MSDFEIEDSPLPPAKSVWFGNPTKESWVKKAFLEPDRENYKISNSIEGEWTQEKSSPEEQWSGRKVEPIQASYPPPFTNYLIGGPLNGKRRASVGNARVVQVPHEGATLLYERGDKPNNDAIYFCGSIEEGSIELNERILSNS